MERDCNSREPQRTIYPGRMSAIEDWARAEKQKRSPPRMLPNARARKDVNTAAEISKMLLYSSDFGATMSWRKPSKHPSINAIGMSIRRPWNASNYQRTFSSCA